MSQQETLKKTICVGRHDEVKKVNISGVLWKSSAQEPPAGVGSVGTIVIIGIYNERDSGRKRERGFYGDAISKLGSCQGKYDDRAMNVHWSGF